MGYYQEYLKYKKLYEQTGGIITPEEQRIIDLINEGYLWKIKKNINERNVNMLIENRSLLYYLIDANYMDHRIDKIAILTYLLDLNIIIYSDIFNYLYDKVDEDGYLSKTNSEILIKLLENGSHIINFNVYHSHILYSFYKVLDNDQYYNLIVRFINNINVNTYRYSPTILFNAVYTKNIKLVSYLLSINMIADTIDMCLEFLIPLFSNNFIEFQMFMLLLDYTDILKHKQPIINNIRHFNNEQQVILNSLIDIPYDINYTINTLQYILMFDKLTNNLFLVSLTLFSRININENLQYFTQLINKLDDNQLIIIFNRFQEIPNLINNLFTYYITNNKYDKLQLLFRYRRVDMINYLREALRNKNLDLVKLLIDNYLGSPFTDADKYNILNILRNDTNRDYVLNMVGAFINNNIKDGFFRNILETFGSKQDMILIQNLQIDQTIRRTYINNYLNIANVYSSISNIASINYFFENGLNNRNDRLYTDIQNVYTDITSLYNLIIYLIDRGIDIESRNVIKTKIITNIQEGIANDNRLISLVGITEEFIQRIRNY